MPYLKSAPSSLSNCKTLGKKCLYLGPKMPDFGIFWLKFENHIVIFQISPLKFFWVQNFAEKQKCLNIGPKMRYLCVFGLECLKKTIVIFEISAFEFFLITKYQEIVKMSKLRLKMTYLSIFGLEFKIFFVIFKNSTVEFF